MKAYRSRPIKRKRRTSSEIQTVKDGLFRILAKDHPQTVRGVFYQAVTQGIIPKTEEAYKHTVIRLLGEMRKDGTLPFSWLADNTRLMRRSDAYEGADHALYYAWKYYRHDIFSELDDYIEIWCEKDAVAGVIFQETDAWTVPLMISRGFASLSFLHSAGMTIAAKWRQGKRTFIYYLGDLDPSGISISQNIEKGLRRYSGDAEVIFKRVAVTREQVELMNLPTRPTKKTDSRAKTWEGDSVELDAIPAQALKLIVRDCITKHVPEHTQAYLNTVEQNERAALYRLYEMSKGAHA